MPSTLLTDSKIRGLKPKKSAYYAWQAAATRRTGRLAVKVYPSGKKSFVYRTFLNGAAKFISLGNFPTLTLAEAMSKIASIAQDGDSISSDVASKSYASLKDLCDAYINHQEISGKRSFKVTNSRLQQVLRSKHIDPAMLAKEVTPNHIKLVLSEAIERGAIAGSNKIRAALHAVFNHGLHADNDPAKINNKTLYGLDRNPVSVVPRQEGCDKALDRFLTWDELKSLILECSKEEPEMYLTFDFAMLLLLCLFTGGQRPWELMANTRNNIDYSNNTLTVPPHISKNSDFHVIPLCNYAIDILKKMENRYDSPFIFPAKTQPGHLLSSEFAKQIRKFCKFTQFDKFTPRDIRRTFKTLAGEMGISSELRDLLQNHIKPGVSRKHYDRYSYLKEKKEVISLWETKLLQLISI